MFVLPATALAVDVLTPACSNAPAGTPAICQDNQTGSSNTNNPIFGPNGLVTTGVQILTLLIGIATIIVIIISGIRFITSGGNAENIAKGRRGLAYAIIGLIITATAQVIVSFVLSKV